MTLDDRPPPAGSREKPAWQEETKIMRRLAPHVETQPVDALGVRMALVVDTETTGLEADAEIVELAMRPISYRVADGVLVGIHPAYVGLQEPRSPLSPEVSALVGLTDDDLLGCRIDLDAVETMVRSSSLVIAHSARFDRPHLERLSPLFASMPWACSIEDADWASEGIESSKLAYVAAFAAGFFYDPHRALDDVDAVIAILRGDMPKSGGPVLAKILSSARAGRCRLRVRASFESRVQLKARGYKWDPGSAERSKNWFKDFADAAAADREATHVSAWVDPDAQFNVARLDALSRFSERT